MSKFLLVPAVVFMGLVSSCNSGSDQSPENKIDSLITIDSPHHDHEMNMSSVEPVPDIPAGAKVFFRNLKNGQTVSSPVKVEMGTEVIKVDTAGVIKPGYGHHHLLVDAGDSTAAGVVVGKDSTHIHFGKGQIETTLPLTPGKHTLTLQFADGIHRSYGGKLSNTIQITVK